LKRDYNGTLPVSLTSSLSLLIPAEETIQVNLFLFLPLFQTRKIFQNVTLPPGILGKRYVLFGSSSSVHVVNDSMTITDLASPDQKIEYVSLGAGLSLGNFPLSMATIPDVNGDSFADLLIGNPQDSEVYLIFGDNFRFSRISNGLTVFGEKKGDNLGWAISSAGDFNGDGFTDILISAWELSRCYVLFGKTKDFQDISLSQLRASDGLRILGPTLESMNFGVAVSNAGDFNQDGYEDIIVSARGPTGDNTIYLIYGFPVNAVNLDLNTMKESMGFRIKAPRLSFAGLSLAGLGDVNGDGFDDIAIGSVPYNKGYSVQVSYIIYGKNTSTNHDCSLTELTMNFNDRGRMIVGGGIMVAGPGDVDGDGFNDLMIIEYGDWIGSSSGTFIIRFPSKASVSRRPSMSPSPIPSLAPFPAPSSSPTATSTSSKHPSSFPTSSPSMPSSRPTSTPSSKYSSRPSPLRIRPTWHPSVRPSPQQTALPSPSPTRIPSSTFRPTTSRPSATPTILPSFQPTRKPSPKPSFRPTTHAPSINCNPTSFPTMSPTIVVSKPWISREIVNGGLYTGNNSILREVYVINTKQNVQITGNEKGRNIYKIIPNANVTISIVNFKKNMDLFDLSLFSTPSALQELSYQSSPFTILLPDDQSVVLTSHSSFDLTEENFIFSNQQHQDDDNNDDGSKNVSKIIRGHLFMDTTIITAICIIAGILLLTIGCCQVDIFFKLFGIKQSKGKGFYRSIKEYRFEERRRNQFSSSVLPMNIQDIPIKQRQQQQMEKSRWDYFLRLRRKAIEEEDDESDDDEEEEDEEKLVARLVPPGEKPRRRSHQSIPSPQKKKSLKLFHMKRRSFRPLNSDALLSPIASDSENDDADDIDDISDEGDDSNSLWDKWSWNSLSDNLHELDPDQLDREENEDGGDEFEEDYTVEYFTESDHHPLQRILRSKSHVKTPLPADEDVAPASRPSMITRPIEQSISFPFGSAQSFSLASFRDSMMSTQPLQVDHRYFEKESNDEEAEDEDDHWSSTGNGFVAELFEHGEPLNTVEEDESVFEIEEEMLSPWGRDEHSLEDWSLNPVEPFMRYQPWNHSHYSEDDDDPAPFHFGEQYDDQFYPHNPPYEDDDDVGDDEDEDASLHSMFSHFSFSSNNSAH
jgi:hypothetical protein